MRPIVRPHRRDVSVATTSNADQQGHLRHLAEQAGAAAVQEGRSFPPLKSCFTEGVRFVLRVQASWSRVAGDARPDGDFLSVIRAQFMRVCSQNCPSRMDPSGASLFHPLSLRPSPLRPSVRLLSVHHAFRLRFAFISVLFPFFSLSGPHPCQRHPDSS